MLSTQLLDAPRYYGGLWVVFLELARTDDELPLLQLLNKKGQVKLRVTPQLRNLYRGGHEVSTKGAWFLDQFYIRAGTIRCFRGKSQRERYLRQAAGKVPQFSEGLMELLSQDMCQLVMERLFSSESDILQECSAAAMMFFIRPRKQVRGVDYIVSRTATLEEITTEMSLSNSCAQALAAEFPDAEFSGQVFVRR
jgi:hypothetical protein